MPLAVVAAIGVAAVTVISARSDDDECHRGKGSAKVAALAELVGTDAEGLKTALKEGNTLAEIAEQNGVEVQAVIDALVEQANQRIDAAVEAGKMTTEEGETKKSEAAARIADGVNNGFNQDRFRSWGKGRWRGYGAGLGHGIETS